jgi:hypothetical protein
LHGNLCDQLFVRFKVITIVRHGFEVASRDPRDPGLREKHVAPKCGVRIWGVQQKFTILYQKVQHTRR